MEPSIAQTFPTYRHSGKFSWHGPLIAFLAATILGFPLGLAYAFVLRWMPVVYARFLLPIGYGLVAGFGAAYILKYCQVRNNVVAGLTGFGVGCILLYHAWSGYTYATFPGAPIFVRPREIAAGMKHLYANGSWRIDHNDNLKGISLGIIWIGEGFMILCIATVISGSVIAGIPFCEKTGRWLDRKKKIDCLQTFTDSEDVAAFKGNDLTPLLRAKRKENSAQTYGRVTVKYAPECRSFFTVRVENVTLEKTLNGGTSKTVQKVTNADLILPQSMFESIMKLETLVAS